MEARVQPIAMSAEKVCLLRLSAIGDTCHVVPLLRTLQDAWPRTRFTWVIGKLEAKLMGLIPDVELITVDKGAGLAAYQAAARRTCAGAARSTCCCICSCRSARAPPPR